MLTIALSHEEAFAQWVRAHSVGVHFAPDAPCFLTRDFEEAKRALEDGKIVLFVGGPKAESESLRTRFSRVSRGNGHFLQWTEPHLTLGKWQSWLWEHAAQTPLPPIPAPSDGFHLVVRSSPQSGGTFFAWNLWYTLVHRGVSARLVTVSPTTPLGIWMRQADDRVTRLTDRGSARADVWIVDASGTLEAVQGDVTVVVADGDPAKTIPAGDVAVENRATEQGLPAFAEAAEAMRSGVPVAAVRADFAQWLWDWYIALRGFENRPDDILEDLPAEPVREEPIPASVLAPGFWLDVDFKNPSKRDGFLLDA